MHFDIDLKILEQRQKYNSGWNRKSSDKFQPESLAEDSGCEGKAS